MTIPYAVTPADLRRSAKMLEHRDPALSIRLLAEAEAVEARSGKERDRLMEQWKEAAARYGARSNRADAIWHELRRITHQQLGAKA